MSTPGFLNELDDKALSEVEKDEAKQLSPSRRRFLRNVAVGALGSTMVMSRGERVLARQTQSHVNLLFAPVTSYNLEPGAKQDFLNAGRAVLSVVNEGGDAKSTFDAIRSYIASPLGSIPPGQYLTELGVPKDASDTIATAYLRSLVSIKDKQITESQIKQGLANPKAIFDSFESDFVKLFADRVKKERDSSPGFAQKLADATAHFKIAAEELGNTKISRKKDAKSGKIKLVALKRHPAFTPPQCDCEINGNCAPWYVCVGVVVVIVIIIIAK